MATCAGHLHAAVTISPTTVALTTAADVLEHNGKLELTHRECDGGESQTGDEGSSETIEQNYDRSDQCGDSDEPHLTAGLDEDCLDVVRSHVTQQSERCRSRHGCQEQE
jgi:hypothetical protein